MEIDQAVKQITTDKRRSRIASNKWTRRQKQRWEEDGAKLQSLELGHFKADSGPDDRDRRVTIRSTRSSGIAPTIQSGRFTGANEEELEVMKSDVACESARETLG